jgi:hypothetical protein
MEIRIRFPRLGGEVGHVQNLHESTSSMIEAGYQIWLVRYQAIEREGV